jgi:hypothetical protein
MPVGFRAPTAADECIEQLTPVCDWASINALILYAQRRGAFIDLAADLSWLIGRDPSEFVLDHHFTLPNHLDAPEGLTVASVINQAIGVLIAHGRTPEQAHRELGARAARGGLDRRNIASRILTNPAVHCRGTRSRLASVELGNDRDRFGVILLVVGFSIYIPIVSTLGVVVLILAAEGFGRAGVSACRDVWRDPRGTAIAYGTVIGLC